jgi:hypothetical protein
MIPSDGSVRLTVPRSNPINAITMGAIASDAGLTPSEFTELLYTGAMRTTGVIPTKPSEWLFVVIGGLAATLAFHLYG